MTRPSGASRRAVRLGPTGRRVAARLRQLRGDLSLQTVADRLTEAGHPISADGISKIELGQRRVDVDDLLALALALNVSPITLLLDDTSEPLELSPNVTLPAQEAWRWARVTADTFPPADFYDYQRRSLPQSERRYGSDKLGFMNQIKDDPEGAYENWQLRFEATHGPRDATDEPLP